jgi:P pilus assembly chaperone PapD
VIAEPGIVQQEPKSIQADFALADVFMPVDAGAKFALGIVQVKEPEPADSDCPVKS